MIGIANVNAVFYLYVKAQRWFSEHDLTILSRGCLDRVQSRVKRVVATSVTCCTYTYYYRSDSFELLATFLSVFNGLLVGLRFIVPYLVRIIMNIQNRFRTVRMP